MEGGSADSCLPGSLQPSRWELRLTPQPPLPSPPTAGQMDQFRQWVDIALMVTGKKVAMTQKVLSTM